MTTRRTSAGRSPLAAAALALGAVLLALPAGCASTPAPVAPSVAGTYDIGAVVRANGLGSMPARLVEAHRGPNCSIHIVQVADAIAPHVHAHSDETVIIWRGAGVMLVGGEALDVGAGQLVHIPAGVAHSFRLTSTEPAIGVSVMTPGLQKGDRQAVSK